MADYDPEFHDGEWYRCRVEPGAVWDEFRSGTLYLHINLKVTGGEMAEKILPLQAMLSAKDSMKKQFAETMAVFGFDALKTDLGTAAEAIEGKECWAKCQIQPKERGTGHYPPRASDIRDINSRIPGGIAYKAALLLGNVATGAPDPEKFNDQY